MYFLKSGPAALPLISVSVLENVKLQNFVIIEALEESDRKHEERSLDAS